MYEEGGNHDSKAVRSNARRSLHNGNEVASEGADSRSGKRRATTAVSRLRLSNPRQRFTTGLEAGAEADEEGNKEKDKQIDPLTLPYVMMSELRYLPTCAGIYFAIEEAGQVAYIGQSTNIYNRWRGHHVQGDLCDLTSLEAARRVRLAWLEVADEGERLTMERALIRRFRPHLNDTYNRPTLSPAIPNANRSGGMEQLSVTEAAELLTAKEVAELLQVGRSTINLWCRQGAFKGARQEETPFGAVWYIPRSALVGFQKPARGRPKKEKAETKATKKRASQKSKS